MSPVPVDPYPDFVPHTPALADQVDARFKKLYDTLNPAVAGLDDTNVKTGGLWPAVTTTLPASPRDGAEAYLLVDTTAGIVWHLRYRAASASSFEWEFVGGNPMYNSMSTTSATITGTTYTLITLPLINVPRSGEYRVRFGGAISISASGLTAAWTVGGPGVGLAAADANALYSQGAASSYDSASRSVVVTLTGSGAIQLYGRNFGASNTTITNAWIELLPVRVLGP
jgi:hypothetical protein